MSGPTPQDQEREPCMWVGDNDPCPDTSVATVGPIRQRLCKPHALVAYEQEPTEWDDAATAIDVLRTAIAEQRETLEAERDRHNAAYMKLATLVLDASPQAKIHGMMAPEQAEAAVVRALKQIIARAAIRRTDARQD